MPSIEIKINSKEKTPEEKAKNKRRFNTAVAIISGIIAGIFGICGGTLYINRYNDARINCNNHQVIMNYQEPCNNDSYLETHYINYWSLIAIIAPAFIFGAICSTFWDKDHAKKKKS